MRIFLRSRLLSVAAAAAVVAAGFAALPGTAQADSPTPYQLGSDGTTAPVDSYVDAIRETVWVDIGMDQDGDGINDRVAVDIIRPAEADAAGQRVPVIMDTSGYYQSEGRGNENQIKTYDSNGQPVQFPLFYDNYFVPRGYAVALTDLAGTNRSTGCTDYGGPSELASSTRVIDWLNGRAPGYSSPLGKTREYAGWASGAVGMIGKSWDGQNAIETAVTGISGLDAIVPESAPTSDWTLFYDGSGSASYDQTTADYTLGDSALQNARAFNNKKCQALLQAVNKAEPIVDNTAKYTPAWAFRDFSARAGQVKAAVLMTQGQNDENVFPYNVGPFWSKLPAAVPKKLWLSETGHVEPFDFRRAQWVDTVHRWFDRFLYQIHNGIDRTPQLSVERAPDKWVDYPTFPAAGVTTQRLYTVAGASTGPGVLAARPGPATTVALDAAAPMAEFDTPPLAKPLRLSGTPEITTSITSSVNRTINVEVYVFDLGPATTRGYSGSPDSSQEFTGILNPRTTESCWGESGPGDSACFYNTPPDVVTVDHQFIGWGTADLNHRSSITTIQSVKAGQTYTLHIPSYTMDRILPAGHRLSIQISAYGPSGFTAGLHLATTQIALPVVGTTISFRGSATP